MINRKQTGGYKIQWSQQSSDFIPPSFISGCSYKCAYCTIRRYNPEDVNIREDWEDILRHIAKHHRKLPPKQSYLQLIKDKTKQERHQQTDAMHWVYDISCNEDFALHRKWHEWRTIFDYFKYSKAKATLASKYIPTDFLDYDPNKKVRIRFSLMPQQFSDLLEPKTTKIKDRIAAVDKFVEAGYDVDLNFSPVIVHDGWEKLYQDLLEQVNDTILHKDEVNCEVIFLTHSKRMHLYNMIHCPEVEKLLWKPHMQVAAVSQTGTPKLRYKDKWKYVNKFKEWHGKAVPWNNIRYIF